MLYVYDNSDTSSICLKNYYVRYLSMLHPATGLPGITAKLHAQGKAGQGSIIDLSREATCILEDHISQKTWCCMLMVPSVFMMGA